MSLLIKHNRAEHTHENEQFRRVAISLRILFERLGWSGLLLGNPFNEIYYRFRPDAILIYDHGLFIIDFKDYSGTILLPDTEKEFNSIPWYTESDRDKSRLLIKAGSHFINPYRQLNSYRGAFKEIVDNEIILSRLINKDRTCIINIFSGPLNIKNRIPKSIPYYKIAQESDLGNLLYDYSSENKYSEESAESLLRIFNAEDWIENIELPKQELLPERAIKIDENVESEISKFLKIYGSGILILESMEIKDRDDWLQYILAESRSFNIPQVESWIHSTRIGYKTYNRLGIKLQSLYATIYGGAEKLLENEYVDEEEDQPEDLLQEIVPIRKDDTIDVSAVIILHEAHLVTRSLHQSDLLRFGTGRLLEDMLNFLNLKGTKRKLICIGDPYSLTFGKNTDSALYIETLKELFDGQIRYHKKALINNSDYGKSELRDILANGIENKIFNNLKYPWKADDLIELNREEVSNFLSDWYSYPLESEPNNAIMVYKNKDANKINLHIKNKCLKNGNELAPKDLLLVNNNINISDEIGFGLPTKLYNGMYLLVEEVCEATEFPVPIKQSNNPILLKFTKLKVKCLSLPQIKTCYVLILNNYFENGDGLSKEEQIAFRVFVKSKITKASFKQSFINSLEYEKLLTDEGYNNLTNDEKESISILIENYLILKKEDKHEVKTTRIARKVLSNYRKEYEARILKELRNSDPFINAAYVNYGWALTVHKCICTTFGDVLLNASQGENRGVTNDDYYRWLYSGITATSGKLRIVNPQVIHPLMDVCFEFEEGFCSSSNKVKKRLLEYEEIHVDEKYKNKLPTNLNNNVRGCIIELTQKYELLGYTLENVYVKNEYLTKALFLSSESQNTNFILVVNNKGAKDRFKVSSIRIEANNGVDESKLKEIIEKLFLSECDSSNDNSRLPTDFRESIYRRWMDIMSDQHLKLELSESHRNQDLFEVKNEELVAKFRVWYKDSGFISKIVVIAAKDDLVAKNLKKWLLYYD